MNTLEQALSLLLLDVARFSQFCGGLRLRSYQAPVARAVIQSVLQGRGLSFVVLFPRQSGKNELQAQIETYLLLLLSREPAEMVKVSPTWKPQAQNAMRRLERALRHNLLAQGRWVKESGYIYRYDNARITFLSGAPEANIVGATASALLEIDEAQDVLPAKYDKDIAPMAASTNATRVFWGTAWSAQTLLARELRAARQAEEKDGQRRAFVLTADDVAREVPTYGQFVAGQVARLGRSHPMIRTQFYSEEIDDQGGLFPPARQALLFAPPAPVAPTPRPGGCYALLLDIAGADETQPTPAGDNPTPLKDRDSTAATLVEIDLTTLSDPLLAAPRYRALLRLEWVGVPHAQLYGPLRTLAETWNVRRLVVDATGIGAGLASFLHKALGERVIPFTFTAASKSKLGWDFLALIDAGRFSDCTPAGPLRQRFTDQLSYCQYQVLDGPAHLLRWAVPDGARHPHTGEPLHDDLLLSAALCAVLDGCDWRTSGGPTLLVRAADPLDEMDRGF